MSEVYVVTSTDLGWDCVVDVFDANSVSKESLEEVFDSEDGYIIHSVRVVQKDTFDYQEEDE
jgi:hypothetical protein